MKKKPTIRSLKQSIRKYREIIFENSTTEFHLRQQQIDLQREYKKVEEDRAKFINEIHHQKTLLKEETTEKNILNARVFALEKELEEMRSRFKISTKIISDKDKQIHLKTKLFFDVVDYIKNGEGDKN